MALPRTLKNFNVFVDGVSFMGVATEVALPKLARKQEDYRGGGMNGPVGIDLGVEKLEIEHTYGGLVREMFKSFGISKIDGVLLRFAGAYQREDTGDTDAIEIVVRGRHKELDFGNAKIADKSTTKVKTVCSYYKLTVNGEVIIEFDALAMIFVVGGTDMLEAQRKAIGLA